MAAADGNYSLFDAIIARAPLVAIQTVVEDRPQSVQDKPTRRAGRRSLEWATGSTALHLAILHGLSDAAVLFLYRCHPPNLRERDATGCIPLHYLERNYRRGGENELSLETIQHLVREWPESLQQTNDKHQLVLHSAAANENLPLEVFRFLVDSHPRAIREKDVWGRTPLLTAVAWGAPTIDRVRYLMEQFPPALRERDNDGNLPIHAAANNRSLSVGHIRCLVEGWPDSVRDRHGHGQLPLHLAAGRTSHAHSLPIVRYLLEMYPESIRDGADEGGENGYLAVHAAIHNAAPHELIRLLVLRYPECLEVWTEAGCLALHIAVSNEASVETLAFLVEQSPQAVREVERDGYGCIALHSAAVRPGNPPSALRLLLGVWPESVLFRNGVGRTALHICANDDRIREGTAKFEAMQLLVEQGPGALRMHDAFGKTPLQTLLTRKDPDLPVVRYLVEAWPRSVLVPTADGESYALFLAAANSDIKLDVLYYLVKQWPGHYFVRQR
jgi:ankyrin repeat protein